MILGSFFLGIGLAVYNVVVKRNDEPCASSFIQCARYKYERRNEHECHESKIITLRQKMAP
jgi:hypothetical protein